MYIAFYHFVWEDVVNGTSTHSIHEKAWLELAHIQEIRY